MGATCHRPASGRRLDGHGFVAVAVRIWAYEWHRVAPVPVPHHERVLAEVRGDMPWIDYQ
jgi:hypothetical protein